jgi:hypothetical protein
MLGIRTAWRPLALVAGLVAATSIAPAAASAAEQSFSAAGEHAFVVPVGVRTLHVTLVGGHGGAGSLGSTNQAEGGPGATARAALSVAPGATLYAQVAADGAWAGAGGDGGYGGGGAGGPVVALLGGAPGGGGGGGASAVRTCPAAGAGCTPMVVAGGGGGGGGAGRDTTPTINGGNGGPADMAGSDGEFDATKHDAGGGGGQAGNASGGGAAGGNSYETPATAGQLGRGGAGGVSIAGGGGGGGGGLFGGGGAGAGNAFADFYTKQFFGGAGGGGGGGSSGVPPGASGVSGFSLVPTSQNTGPSVTFSWTPPAPAASTGAVSAITSASATLTGTVNPNLSQVTDCHFTIAPAAATGATVPCAQQLGAGDAATAVSATLLGLTPTTRYTVSLVATNGYGVAEGAAMTFTTAGAGSGAAARPRVSALKLSPSKFRRGTHRARLAPRGRSRAGTTVSFALSAAAEVRLTFERARPGRRYKRVAGGVRLAARAGASRIHFDGVLDSRRRLARGTYRLALVALDRAGRPSPAQRARFTIMR